MTLLSGGDALGSAAPHDAAAPAAPASRSAYRVAPLLFFSGACALVYQVAWQREFRLVFGASTAASAAVIAIFIAGLGAGGLKLGRKADGHPRPLELYAHLEIAIALLAAATPALFWLVRKVYTATGGSFAMGQASASLLRLALSTLVLAAPTFLMGGTLPAAARAVERDADASRRDVALLYGINTLGAVSGAVFATFLSLEVFGTRMTLVLACLVNALLGVTARAVARTLPETSVMPQAEGAKAGTAADPRVARFALVAALLVGFAFFLMEIVWYRMLGPLLGGTVFTFGLVLAVALFGIGLGGALYGVFGERREAKVSGFAVTCLVEACAVIVPFAMGDRLALLALRLTPLSAFGFLGQVASWAVVAGIVILPAAVAAGYQFPLLIALVGRGRESVGEQIGRVYAWNTVGAIGGSVAGGFGLLPLLSATGSWRLVAVVLAALGVAALGLSLVSERATMSARLRELVAPCLWLGVTLPFFWADGPSALWRHTSIGVGRADMASAATPNDRKSWATTTTRHIVWAKDGVESSVAIDNRNGIAFIVNGKNDGNSRSDGGTQVMCGLLSTLLHPAPKKGLVIGLGTGSTGGWMASVPEMERVDVIELEPLVLEMARRSAPVNQNALQNPKLRVLLGDGREAMLTLPDRYDVIASEPSNPYRAGIASLYTKEFYESASKRLTDTGIFAQWLQGYEVDAQTVRTVIATIASVFPYVEIWELKKNDILLQASMKPLVYDVERLQKRTREEPFRSALRVAWRTEGLEGVLSHFVARPTLAASIRKAEGDALNTDDTTLVEFGFARGLVRSYDLAQELRRLGRQRKEDMPELVGAIDPVRSAEERAAMVTTGGSGDPMFPPGLPPAVLARQRARKASMDRVYGVAVEEWKRQEDEPKTYTDIWLMAEAAAEVGAPEVTALITKLRALDPLEATCVEARAAWTAKKYDEATAKTVEFLHGLRRDPWSDLALGSRCLQLAGLLPKRAQQPAALEALAEAVSQPFAVSLHEVQRLAVAREIALARPRERCAAAFELSEPLPEWTLSSLEQRAACYGTTGHPLAAQAAVDLRAFLREEPPRLGQGLD